MVMPGETEAIEEPPMRTADGPATRDGAIENVPNDERRVVDDEVGAVVARLLGEDEIALAARYATAVQALGRTPVPSAATLRVAAA